jgi:hypothetical protein
MNDNKFWLLFWIILATTIIILVGSGMYAGYLNDKKDQHYVDQGLQSYQINTCKEYSYSVEWHEAGWSNQNTITILKD